MPQNKSILQSLWEELNQDEALRRQKDSQALLQQRALDYAAPLRETVNFAEDEIYQVLSFRLGSEIYGIDVAAVTGVRPLERITRVPNAPIFYRGVLNVRGQIISVLDLRAFFGIGLAEISPKSELILLNAHEMSLALLADRVEEVETIPRHEVEVLDLAYAKGISRKRLIILELRTLLSDERLIIGGKTEE